jgi:hypothetical protein
LNVSDPRKKAKAGRGPRRLGWRFVQSSSDSLPQQEIHHETIDSQRQLGLAP